MGYFSMATRLSRWSDASQSTTWSDAKRSTHEIEERGPQEGVILQGASSRTTVASAIYWGRLSGQWRRRSSCGHGEPCVAGHCAQGGEHSDSGTSSTHCGRKFNSCAVFQGAEAGSGQDGQGPQEVSRRAVCATKPSFQLAQIHRRFTGKVDTVCGEVWKGRPRACGKGENCSREAPADQRGCRDGEARIRGARHRDSDRDYGRRDERQTGLLRGDPGKHLQDGREPGQSSAKGRCSIVGGGRDQAEATASRSYGAAGRLQRWIGLSVLGAFCTARQVDLTETCPGREPGSPAVLLNWSHSILTDANYMNPWRASIEGLDLAWEMGTTSLNLKPSSTSATFLRPKRSRTMSSGVSFSNTQEVYVGEASSLSFLCWQLPLGPLAEHQNLQDFINAYDPEQHVHDEVSWMAMGVHAHGGAPQPFLDRDDHAVFDNPAAAHDDRVELEIEVQADIDIDENDDGSSESGSDRSTSTEPRRPVLIYSIDEDPTHCRPRWETYEKLHSDLAHHMKLSSHDVTMFHSVSAVPEDLQLARVHPFICQKPQDITEGSTFQFVLLDVEFHNAMPSLDPEVVRRVKLLPKTISRKVLLAVLGLQPYCRYARNICFIWHNNHLIGAQHKSLLDIRHGDYVRVAVPPARGVLRQYYTREVAQCFRRGYTATNIPTVLENYPAGFDVADMPLIDTFAYVPRVEDLDYDRDAMALLQLPGPTCPELDAWPPFLQRPIDVFPWECKVADEDRREGDLPAASIEPLAEPGRPELAFGEIVHFLHELRQGWELHAAVEQEEEGRILYVNTWYSDHERFPDCEQMRPVRLRADTWNWPNQIAEAWDDRVDPDAVLHFFLIRPIPRASWPGSAVVPHVLIVQHPRPARRSVHIYAIDAGEGTTTARSFVTVIDDRVSKSSFYEVLGIETGRMVESLIDCMVSHGDIEINHYELFPVRHGFGFLVILNHLRDIISRAASSSASSTARASGLHLLQTAASRVTLKLEEQLHDVLFEDEGSGSFEVLQVQWAAEPQPHPTYIEVPLGANDSEIQFEFQKWGLSCKPVSCRERGMTVCLPQSSSSHELLHYVFVNMDLTHEEPLFLHSCAQNLTMHEIMVHLHKLGFWRAVVVQQDEPWPGIHKVCFQDQQVVVSKATGKARGQPDWPAPQPDVTGLLPHYHRCQAFPSKQLIDLGINEQDILDLFDSHQNLLQEHVPDDVPAEIRSAIDSCDSDIPLEELNRLLIYTDGSSLSGLKHLPPQRAEEEGLGDTWAMVVLGERYQPPGLRFMGWSAQPVLYEQEHNFHLGAQRLGADIAEKEGLSWAGLWRLSQNWSIPTCFRSDSRVALGQASGQTGTAQIDETFTFLRGIFQANESALGHLGVVYSHVPGHAGEPWNECCDWLAKRERERSYYCPRPKLEMGKWKKAVGHLWMVFGSHPDLPTFCGNGLHAPIPALPPAREPPRGDQGEADSHTAKRTMQFALSACSANVNSLSQSPEGHEGKIGYLRQQLRSLRLNFLGIQEARTQEICTCVDQIYRLASGCDGRHQGVELWINLAQPYGWVQGQACYFEKGDFQIAYKDPRILLVRADTPYWNCWLLVAYAPQSGLPWTTREDWWRHLSDVVRRKHENESILIMIDANAAPGSPDGRIVHGSDHRTSSSTPLFREFAEDHDLCALNTTQAHQGTDKTWTDPSGERAYWIDYVLASQDLAAACTLSRVVPELDLGHGMWDHEAVAAELSWKASVRQHTTKVKKLKKVDPSKITASISAAILDSYQPADWSMDIETHVDEFNAQVVQGLRLKCHKTPEGAKKSYISEALWKLRRDKLALKERLKGVGRRRREEGLVTIFRAWASLRNFHRPVEGDRFFEYGSFLLCSNIKLTAAFRNITQQLRDGLKTARKKLICQKFEEMHSEASAAQILHELRPILGPTNSNLKKQKVSTLPYVRNSEGAICSLPNEAVAVWSDFFRHMEGGERMSLERQREIWRQNLAEFSQSEFHIAGDDIPNLAALEAAYRRINPTKAVGPDEVYPGFCRMAPHLLARKTYGQLLKLLTHGHEALIHKGGVLHPIWKMKGPRDLCSSYRSILISSHVGKSLHRSLRQHQTGLFSKFLQTEQLGGRPRIPVTLVVHTGRAFLRSRKALGHNVAMLYLDLTEAFYRILRPLVVGGPIDDELIMHVGARLGMSTDLMTELYKHLEEPTALSRAHVPLHLQNAIRALHEDTHFHVRGQRDICRTTLGSRPGDSFADVIFSYLWGRILHSLQSQLQEIGLGESIAEESGLRLPLHGERPSEHGELCRPFLGPTWMDDTCVCVSDECPVRLERKITQASGTLLSLCESHGLSPNLQPGKSEVLLAFSGRGSRRMKIRYFGPQSDRTLTLVGEMETKKIRVVNKYNHLGCVIHHRSDNRDEARRRLGIAQQAFTQHRRHLLQNPALSMKRRTELFVTLIMSRFC